MLERRRPAVLHRVPKPVQRPDPGVAAPRERQRAGAAGADHLVVDEVGRHADQVKVFPPLPDEFVARGERDQVREALHGHALAVADVPRERFREIEDGHGYSTTVWDCSRMYWGR